jgi:uncharacterized protein YjbI with pentapeptide repeats
MEATIKSTSFIKCMINSAYLCDANQENTIFWYCDLAGCNFNGQDKNKIVFQNCNLKGLKW